MRSGTPCWQARFPVFYPLCPAQTLFTGPCPPHPLSVILQTCDFVTVYVSNPAYAGSLSLSCRGNKSLKDSAILLKSKWACMHYDRAVLAYLRVQDFRPQWVFCSGALAHERPDLHGGGLRDSEGHRAVRNQRCLHPAGGFKYQGHLWCAAFLACLLTSRNVRRMLTCCELTTPCMGVLR